MQQMIHKTEMLRNLGLLRRVLRPVSSTVASRSAIGRIIGNRGYRSCGHCKSAWYCGGPCPAESKAPAKNGEESPKPDETESDASYEKRYRKVRTFLIGAVVIAGISSAVACEWLDRENERKKGEKERKTREKERKTRESRDLKICIMKALKPYVPPSIGLEGATDLVHLTPALADVLRTMASKRIPVVSW